MNFVLNEIDVEGLRTDTFRGREFLVAPVTAMKAMNLDGGYVPQEHVKKSVPAWNGTPVTLNHPETAEGDRVSANSPQVAEKTWLGYFFNAQATEDGKVLDGEMWLETEPDREIVSEIHENLQEGDAYPVSTAYFGDDLGAGEYDGEFRDNAVGNLKPDHLALLTSGDGKCSLEDGCMAGQPATNAPKIAQHAEKNMDVDELGEEAAESFINQVTDYFKVEDMTERNEMIEVLTNEHGFKEESLENMGDSCLERTYESFEAEEQETSETEDEANVNETEETEDEGLTAEKVGEIVETKVNEAVENTVEEKLTETRKEEKREELVDEIVSNSEDYESDDLEETPLSVLENVADDLDTGESADWSAYPGTEARNSAEGEDLPPLSMSEVDDNE